MLTLCISFPFSFHLKAQGFTDLQNGFPTLGSASVAWADYDQDGDLDFALIGFSSVTAEMSRIYRNDGSGVFTLSDSLLVPVSAGAVSWGDYDHDGDVDLLVNGQTGTGPPASTVLYRNDSNSVFTAVPTSLPGIIGVTRWIDYDGDGWLDVIVCGTGVSLVGDSTRLFHNDTNGAFTEVPVGLPGYFASDISVVDFDNDGDNDFFVVGGTLSSTFFPVSILYRNDSNGVFTQVPFQFKYLSTGTSSWADYDNDGDKDLLYDGIDSTATVGFSLIYRNDSAGNFTPLTTNLPGTGEPGSVDWADIDNDGDLDVLLSGPYILRNDGGNVFTDITPATVQQSIPCSFADIDSDGDPDILLISQSGGFSASTILRNDIPLATPEVSHGLDVAVYPNPAENRLTIQTGKNRTGATEIILFNTLGETILSRRVQSGSPGISLDISSFIPAMYYYRITENGLVMQTGKICIK